MQHLLKPTLKLYADPTEKCRQLAVDLVQLLIKTYKPAGEIFLPYLVPVLVLRLGQKDIAEPSEEVRATLLQQVEDIIELAKADLGVYIDEMVQVSAEEQRRSRLFVNSSGRRFLVLLCRSCLAR